MTEAGQPLADATVSAGTLLRQAREAAGLHVAALAANLKVPVRKLEALEEDRFDQLGDAVFIRALASSVCRTLKMDPQPVLERLPQTARPRLVRDTDGINTPFRAPGEGPAPGLPQQISRPVVLIVIALLLAAVVLIFLPQRVEDAASSTARSAEPAFPPGAPAVISPPAENAPAAAVAASAPLAAASGQGATPLAAAAPAAMPAARAASAVGPAAVAASAPALSATAAAATPAAAAASAAALPATGIVTFRTRGSSWIQVTDATGAPVFRRLMGPGEVAGANGALPLAVTIGSVEQTEVQVRGQPFNLGPVSRDNVARFEVK